MARSGHLRHIVEIQQSALTVNASGEPVRGWTTVHQDWASIEPQAGREFIEAMAMGAEHTAIVRMRFVAGITPRMRMMHDAKAYEIKSVADLGGLGRETVLIVESSDGNV
jgi:SPP1 family predicted phage head-tail adaptor